MQKDTIGYVNKKDLRTFILFPPPPNPENWYVVPYDSSLSYDNKVYNPDTGEWTFDDEVRKAAIRVECKERIYERYSQEDQNNLAFLSQDDPERIEAIEWISAMRKTSKDAIANGIKTSVVRWPE